MNTATSSSGSAPNKSGDSNSPGWVRYVAMLTGVLAALGGFITVRGAGLSNEAIYHSSRAVLHQARASDAWSEYQADSVKARIVETQLIASAGDPTARPALEAAAKDLRDRQPAIKKRAEDLEVQRESEVAMSDHRLHEKISLDYGGMFVQLGIALASVAAMTRRKFAFVGGLIAAGIGAGFTVFVMVAHYLVKT